MSSQSHGRTGGGVWFPRLVLAVGGGILLAIGVSCLFSPDSVLPSHGLRLDGPSAYSEARAGFGGMHVAVALVILSGIVLSWMRRPALVFLVAFMAGLALGRIVSVIADGLPPAHSWLYLAIELAIAATGAYALVADSGTRAARAS